MVSDSTLDLRPEAETEAAAQARWRQGVLTWLADQVPRDRLEHILRVEHLSQTWAQQHHLDVQRAGQAGLLHDLAKYFPKKRLLHMAEAAQIPLDAIDYEVPHLLHADISAIVAREEFGLEDAEILSAIADHTLGRPGMSPLSCVVFLADSLEPGRGDTPQLQHLRSLSAQNLDQAVYETCNYSLQNLLDRHHPIHPRTVLTRNWFRRTSRNKASQNHAGPPAS